MAAAVDVMLINGSIANVSTSTMATADNNDTNNKISSQLSEHLLTLRRRPLGTFLHLRSRSYSYLGDDDDDEDRADGKGGRDQQQHHHGKWKASPSSSRRRRCRPPQQQQHNHHFPKQQQQQHHHQQQLPRRRRASLDHSVLFQKEEEDVATTILSNSTSFESDTTGTESWLGSSFNSSFNSSLNTSFNSSFNNNSLNSSFNSSFNSSGLLLTNEDSTTLLGDDDWWQDDLVTSSPEQAKKSLPTPPSLTTTKKMKTISAALERWAKLSSETVSVCNCSVPTLPATNTTTAVQAKLQRRRQVQHQQVHLSPGTWKLELSREPSSPATPSPLVESPGVVLLSPPSSLSSRIPRIRFADEVGLPIETVHETFLYEGEEAEQARRVIILLLSPTHRKFEFVHASFKRSERTTLAEVVQQLPQLATNEVLAQQHYRGLCRCGPHSRKKKKKKRRNSANMLRMINNNYYKNNTTGDMGQFQPQQQQQECGFGGEANPTVFPDTGNPQDFALCNSTSSEDDPEHAKMVMMNTLANNRVYGEELINHIAVQNCGLGQDEILIALLDGYHGKELVKLAHQQIFSHRHVVRAVRYAKRSGRAVKSLKNGSPPTNNNNNTRKTRPINCNQDIELP